MVHHPGSHVETKDRENHNTRAAVAVLLHKDTIQKVHTTGSPAIGSYATLDIVHQLDNRFSAENAYSTVNT